jgi:chlorite dismutase
MSQAYERIEGVEVGQYIGYRFFRIDHAWRRLPVDERTAGKEAFADVVDEFAARMEGLRVYSTVGIRPEADLFLWSITERYDDLLALGAALNGTPLAAWLTTPYSFLGTTKPSVYTDKKRVRQGRVAPRNAPYLVVYPFVKRRPWYFLTFEERANAMREHAEVGGKFVTVTNHTTYSFGIDDQEFIPAFEAEEPADFMHLMMTLRETEASRWTERDTPIFVGKLVDVRVALDALDGAVTELPSAAALYTAPDGTQYPIPAREAGIRRSGSPPLDPRPAGGAHP